MKSFFKRNRIGLVTLTIIFAIVAMAWAGTISQRPYGISTPYWYGYSSGSVASYYLAAPTLSTNDTAVGLAATQTLTNKTLTSPTISGPTISGTAGMASATVSGTLGVTGAATLSGMLNLNGGIDLPITAKTANYTVTAGDAGTIFTNTGATGPVTFVFPEASTVIGQPYRFLVTAAYTMSVDVDDADRIRPTCNAVGDQIQSAGTVGNNLCLMAADATNVVTFGKEVGTWNDAN